MRCEPGQGSTLTQHLTSLIFNEKSTTFRRTGIYPVPQYNICVFYLTPQSPLGTILQGDRLRRLSGLCAESHGGRPEPGFALDLALPDSRLDALHTPHSSLSQTGIHPALDTEAKEA